MSLYKEMTKKALRWSSHYFRYLNECRWFARTIALRYVAYLGAPRERLRYVGLTKDLEANESVPELSELAELVHGKDGYMYFGLSLRFSEGGQAHVDERLHIGIRKVGDTWEVLWADQSINVPVGQPEMLDVLFDLLTAESNEQFASPITTQKRRIGFLSSETAE